MADEQLGRMEAALVRIESTVEELKTDVAGLKTDVTSLKTDVARLDAGQVELGRHMRALHEEALDRIAALQPQWDLFTTKRDVADLKESIDRKLDPLIAVVRTHSMEIADLQRSRDAR